MGLQTINIPSQAPPLSLVFGLHRTRRVGLDGRHGKKWGFVKNHMCGFGIPFLVGNQFEDSLGFQNVAQYLGKGLVNGPPFLMPLFGPGIGEVHHHVTNGIFCKEFL